jgi:hypothetical protein
VPIQSRTTNPSKLVFATTPVRTAIVLRRFRVKFPLGGKLNSVRLGPIRRIR